MTDYNQSPMWHIVEGGGIVQDDAGGYWLLCTTDDYLVWPQGLYCVNITAFSESPTAPVVIKTWPDLHGNSGLRPVAALTDPTAPDDGSSLLRIPADAKKLDGPETADGTLTFIYLKDSYAVPEQHELPEPYAYYLPAGVDYPTPYPPADPEDSTQDGS